MTPMDDATRGGEPEPTERRSGSSDIGHGNTLAFFDLPGLDGERLEPISYPLGEMYGSPVV